MCIRDSCSTNRAAEWESKRQPPVSFAELAQRLAEAGAALGLPKEQSIEENLTVALGMAEASEIDFAPWASWAVVAQALIDAREGDRFLRL